jgi:glycosyltransferase involved in cell wall biosynthesis
MPKLAIVSTYNENCGNASYTHVLKKSFEEHVEVDVLPLDIFLIQKTSPLFRPAADAHIKRMAEALANYDYVNIQFEAGLYGSTVPDIKRRIRQLIQAAPNLIVTMHRVDVGHISFRQAISDSLRLRSTRRFREMLSARRFSRLYRQIINMVRRESSRKNAWIKVHTRRERRVVTEIFGFEKCFDYPLAFLNEEERRDAWAHSDRAAFKRKYGFAETDKLIGLFGYISEYKGIETAIKAIAELPDDYKLVMFGSHHPQSLQANTQLHPYLASLIELIDDIAAERYAADLRTARLRRASAPQQIRVGAVEEALPEPRMPLSERVIFAGNLPDPEFIEALRLVDAAVLPYLEVGQSMSGVVVLGLEAGARLICAQNHSFAEVKRYFGEVFTSFDMGNYIELAQRIRTYAESAGEWDFPEARDRAFERYNIRLSAREQLERFGFQISGKVCPKSP